MRVRHRSRTPTAHEFRGMGILGGEYDPYWSISRHPDRPEHVQIFYALSYLEDGGFISMGGFGSHHGDSEFIIIEATAGSGSVWGVVNVTFSAHWHAGWGSDATATYAAQDLQFPNMPNVRAWVSEGKHANYRSKAVCQSGPNGWWLDSCGGDYYGILLSVKPDHNLGNYFHLPEGQRVDATRFIRDTPSAYSYRQGMENYWEGTDFVGWLPEGFRSNSATGYSEILNFYGF